MVMCIRVPKEKAESFRSKLLADGLLSRDHRLLSVGNDVLIPVVSRPAGMTVEEFILEEVEHKETDYRNLVGIENKDVLPTSFDVIGDVAVIKIPDDLAHLKNDIGKAIMETVRVRVVMMDSGVKGELRIRDLERIAGTGESETIHKEFGVRMITDPSKVYFNPRLATERARIASLVNDGETIIDMFAGVAPFPLVISKHASPKIIYAIDLNEDAAEFAKRNIELNKIKNITVLQGDARVIIKDLPHADRVIMNLPQSASEFLDTALSRTKAGGVIHLHGIIERSELDTFKEQLQRNIKKFGYNASVEDTIELKTYSPTMSVYVFDLRIEN